jgi:hypothetical protein
MKTVVINFLSIRRLTLVTKWLGPNDFLCWGRREFRKFYLEFANENPFLSPTLNIAPTDKQYDVFAGLKGN